MAATDTAVGLAGAVLLVLVMGFVFVYEYTNHPVAGQEGTPGAKADAFHAAHPALKPYEDLDGDHVANVNDTDLDGNGVNDTQQTGDLVVHKQFTGSSAALPTQNGQSTFAFFVGTGNQGLHLSLNWTTLVPAAGQQALVVPNLSVELHDASGAKAGSAGTASAQGSADRSIPLDADGLDAGNYTIVVTTTQPGPQAAPFTVDVHVDYGPAIVQSVTGPGPKSR